MEWNKVNWEKKNQPNFMICAYHRYELGWRPPKCCCHQNHPILLGKKTPTVWTVPYKVLMWILQGHQIPIGVIFYFPHLKSKNNEKNNGKDSSTPSIRKDTANLMHESSMKPDVDFVPDVPYIHVILNPHCLLLKAFLQHLRQVRYIFRSD